MSRAGGRVAGGLAGAVLLMAAAAAEIGEARLEPVGFDALDGWADDDHRAAFRTFLRGCPAILAADPALRPARAPDPGLLPACRAALDAGDPDAAAARAFFERHFTPVRILPPGGAGFLTGYYEPEFAGSREPSGPYRVPLLGRPDDLVTIPQGETLPGLDPALQAARLRPDGTPEPYPDRAAIEDGALSDRARPIVHLKEPGEAFIIQVQGSARIRLPDGAVLRVAYAGRNGHPYTSIGRILIEEGRIPLAEMSLERLMGWLRDNPDEARALMRRNRSYVFFREATELSPADGPIGGAGIPLTPGRSLAVDRSLWSYGLPFWLDGTLPLAPDRSEPLRRLMIAQDTGSAIVGPARGDFYFGSGPEAGTRAGLLRHPTRFVVLTPKP